MTIFKNSKFSKSAEFIFEQGFFSLSSFIFLRNILKDLNLNLVGYVSIYLVASYALLSIIRPLGLKSYSKVVGINSGSPNIYREYSSNLKIPLILSMVSLGCIGFFLNMEGSLKILMPLLGFLFIINDLLRILNIVDGKPQKNKIGNYAVLILSLLTFIPFFQSINLALFYIWLISQFLYLFLLILSRNTFRDAQNIEQFNFLNVGNLLSLENLTIQVISFTFIFILTKLDSEFSGQFRIATSAFTTIPTLIFSALASPYAILIANGKISARNQIIRSCIVFIFFILFYLLISKFDYLAFIISGRNIDDYRRAIVPAVIYAAVFSLTSSITYSFALKLSSTVYIAVKTIPLLFFSLILLIFVDKISSYILVNFMWVYIFTILVLIITIVGKFGSFHEKLSN